MKKFINNVKVHAHAIAISVLKINAATKKILMVVIVLRTPKRNCIFVLLHIRQIAPDVDRIICKGSDNAKTSNIGVAASHWEP